MQMKSDSVGAGGVALPGLREFRPMRTATPRLVRPVNALLAERAVALRVQRWETVTWLILSAITLVSIGICFLG